MAEQAQGLVRLACSEVRKEQVEALRKNTATGRPTGSDGFLAQLEAQLARTLRAQKRGRKPGK